ncbi:MAG: hypothetical protein AABY64_11335 [Bdellovibrionota bacterium]
MDYFFKIIVSSLTISFLGSLAFAAPTWNIRKIDRAASGNRMVQVTLAKNGDKHFVYTGCSDVRCAKSELYYTVLTNSDVVNKTAVDASGDDTGWFPSLTFDANSVAHIFYADHEEQTLRYATNKSSRWKPEDLGSGRGGWWTSSASANNKVYFAHTKLPSSGWDTASLEVGTLENDKWTFETVDAVRNAGWFTSMALLPNGNPVVSYNTVFSQPSGAIKVAIKGETSWDIIDIDDISIKHHVTVDSDGHIHLVYQKAVSNKDNMVLKSTFDLMYATNADGSWKRFAIEQGGTEDVVETGSFPRITTDSKGGLHVVYTRNKDVLIYARKLTAQSSWEFFEVEPLGGSVYPWVEISSSGAVNIAYERGGNIFLATCKDCEK